MLEQSSNTLQMLRERLLDSVSDSAFGDTLSEAQGDHMKAGSRRVRVELKWPQLPADVDTRYSMPV
jgi:hypothetical protein